MWDHFQHLCQSGKQDILSLFIEILYTKEVAYWDKILTQGDILPFLFTSFILMHHLQIKETSNLNGFHLLLVMQRLMFLIKEITWSRFVAEHLLVIVNVLAVLCCHIRRCGYNFMYTKHTHFHAYCFEFSIFVFKSWKQAPLSCWLLPFLDY